MYALLRTGRSDEALEEALALVQLDPADRRSRLALTIARRAATGATPQELGTLLLRYPLLDHPETMALLSHYGSVSLRRARGSGVIEVWP